MILCLLIHHGIPEVRRIYNCLFDAMARILKRYHCNDIWAQHSGRRKRNKSGFWRRKNLNWFCENDLWKERECCRDDLIVCLMQYKPPSSLILVTPHSLASSSSSSSSSSPSSSSSSPSCRLYHQISSSSTVQSSRVLIDDRKSIFLLCWIESYCWSCFWPILSPKT